LAENWSWARDVDNFFRDETILRPRHRDRDHNFEKYSEKLTLTLKQTSPVEKHKIINLNQLAPTSPVWITHVIVHTIQHRTVLIIFPLMLQNSPLWCCLSEGSVCL